MSDLAVLYRRIADMTGASCATGKDECAKFAGNKYRCCERKYCELARRFARDKYGIDLQDTGNLDLPFMTENGCSVEPYLRPICAMHVCTWSWAGKSHIEHDEQKGKEYMELRKQIEKESRKQGKEAINDVD